MAETTAAPHLPVPAPVRIGIDTGGTYTDAVAVADTRVLASAKALTTPWDLSLGIDAALRAVLQELPEAARAQVGLVSVSTTLATNAVVEDRFSPVCIVLVGFSDRMVERSGLRRMAGCHVVRVRGGHEATGEEVEPLDAAAIEAAVREFAPRVRAFAVASLFSVRSPAHELRARDLIRALSGAPVTCSQELSSQLDAPQRALTAALNARLTPPIRQLLDALRRVLEAQRIAAPLMIVKGDGTLMSAQRALEYPVETVLSGPAASLIGAGFLTGLKDYAVADIGGTTTDVAIVIGGRPLVREEGAVIGSWRTMVKAVDVRTCGLGGDSEVFFNRERRLTVGPRKVQPLSLMARQFPQVLSPLRLLAAQERVPANAAQFAYRHPGRVASEPLDTLEQRVWEALTELPKAVADVARGAYPLQALRRLVDQGMATISAFTPSDAMHVLGRQHDWDAEAARLGATTLSTEERNALARREREPVEAFCERVYQLVVRDSARLVLESALAQDPGLEESAGGWGPLGRLLEDTVEDRPFSELVAASLRLAPPLIAIGAPAATYYPEVARRLGVQLLVPSHAAVCNAVGAVAGVVSKTVEVLVTQPALNLFRVHDPAGHRDHPDEHSALAHATGASREQALQNARRAGAHEPHVETTVVERRAREIGNGGFLAEARVISRATGRPAMA